MKYLADLGASPAAALAVRIATATRAFARVLLVERSDDRMTWHAVARRIVVRDARNDARLAVALRGERSRWWRITVGDAGDIPLAAVRVHVVTRSLHRCPVP